MRIQVLLLAVFVGFLSIADKSTGRTSNRAGGQNDVEANLDFDRRKGKPSKGKPSKGKPSKGKPIPGCAGVDCGVNNPCTRPCYCANDTNKCVDGSATDLTVLQDVLSNEISSLTCSNMAEFQLANTKCPWYNWPKCSIQIYKAIKYCYNKIHIIPCIEERVSEKCWGCISRACCALDITQCCNTIHIHHEPEPKECPKKKLLGDNTHHLVGYNEITPDNCLNGCMYAADVLADEGSCFTEADEQNSVNLFQADVTTSAYHCSSGDRGSYICHTYQYKVHDINDFNNFNLQCPNQQSTLNGFTFKCSGDGSQGYYICRYIYTCYPITSTTPVPYSTDPTNFSPNKPSVLDMTKQNVECASQDPIMKFQMVTTGTTTGNMKYQLSCGTVANTPTCTPMSTTPKKAPQYLFVNLQYHALQCPIGISDRKPFLTQFQLHADNTTEYIHYEYTCCVF